MRGNLGKGVIFLRIVVLKVSKMGKNLTSILEMANWGNHVIYMIKFEIEEGHTWTPNTYRAVIR